MLSRYKKIGQFTYFDTRDTKEDLIIKDGVTTDDPKRKYVGVTAAVKENKNSTNKNLSIIYYTNYVT